MAEPNIRWEWPIRLIDSLDMCDRSCAFKVDRSHRYQRGDVKRCYWHGRLYVVSKTEFRGDSNGGATYTSFRRLRPWRLGYWRARKLIPKAARDA